VNKGPVVVAVVMALVIAWIVGGPLLARRRRARYRARSLDEADRMVLRRRVPVYNALPADVRGRLDGLIRAFLEEKQFVGCQGLGVTPYMKLVIAAQACLLVTGRDEHAYDDLRAILVYPSQFVVREQWHDEHGVVTEEESVLSGQAWDSSRIILSWEDVRAGGHGEHGEHGEHAYNVVIHEFAHYLDHEAGGLDGAPALDNRARHARWAQVFQREFEALRRAVERDETTFLDPYAAHDEAEFFAVTSEAFFEAPRELAGAHPALYDELRAFYRLDPAAWR
jgi:Mlc titration factor MtfA (ptsG expression regulator)